MDLLYQRDCNPITRFFYKNADRLQQPPTTYDQINNDTQLHNKPTIAADINKLGRSGLLTLLSCNCRCSGAQRTGGNPGTPVGLSMRRLTARLRLNVTGLSTAD